MSYINKMSNSNWHYAVIGGYITDDNKKIYGITCGHVTQASADGWVYIKTGEEVYARFGRILQKCATTDKQPDLDIDIIEIKKTFHNHCAEWNSGHTGTSVQVFEGDIESLYGKNIRSISGCMNVPDIVYFHQLVLENDESSERLETLSATEEIVSKRVNVHTCDSKMRQAFYFEDNGDDFIRQTSNLSETSLADSGVSFGRNSTGSRQSNISRESGLFLTDSEPCDTSPEYMPTNITSENRICAIGQPDSTLIYDSKNIRLPASEEKANNTDDDNITDDDEDEVDIILYNNYKGVIKGRVCSKDEHQLADIPTHHVLVRCDGKPFKDGDSGTILAFNNDNTLILIGVLISGLEHDDLEQDISYIKCVLLRTGIDYLEKAYGLILSLMTDTQVATRKTLTADELIHPGYIILIKSPEDIKQIEYILLEHVHLLMNTMKADMSDPKQLGEEIEVESVLSRWVSSRGSEMPNMPGNNMLAAVCYHLSIIGVDCLYSGHYEKAEKKLKEACKCLAKTPFRNRLLCKLITYTTWLMLKTYRLSDMLKLLEAGKPFIDDMTAIDICPIRSSGYFYFDYARYYFAMKQSDPALKMNQQCLQYFGSDQTDAPRVGESLALCQRARIHLGCGEDFETRDTPVAQSSITKANECLRQVEKQLEMHVVRVTYLLTSIDYEYRLGHLQQALDTAQRCCREAETSNLREELVRSQTRINILMGIISISPEI